MKTSTRAWALVGAGMMAAIVAAGCSDDDETGNPTTSSTGSPSSSSGTGASGGSGGTGATGGSGGSGGAPASYTFDATPFDQFIQTDRHGAVEAGTVGISATAGLGLTAGQDISLRDDYNASNPEEDAAGMWIPDILASLTALHGALDDDLTAAGVTPADNDESAEQAAPVVIPDTIKFDPSKPVAYPNGRALTDQVVDITIAAALIKLDTEPPTPLNVLAAIPLNPPANDVAFKATFPYLADPH